MKMILRTSFLLIEDMSVQLSALRGARQGPFGEDRAGIRNSVFSGPPYGG